VVHVATTIGKVQHLEYLKLPFLDTCEWAIRQVFPDTVTNTEQKPAILITNMYEKLNTFDTLYSSVHGEEIKFVVVHLKWELWALIYDAIEIKFIYCWPFSLFTSYSTILGESSFTFTVYFHELFTACYLFATLIVAVKIPTVYIYSNNYNSKIIHQFTVI